MQNITAQNIREFYPNYLGYAARRDRVTDAIGVESTVDFKDFRAPIQMLNRESGLGLSEAEENILALQLSEEEANIRFNGNKFIHPQLGGNTGEHPIFLSLKIDATRDAAGFGPSHFSDLDPAHQQAAARLFQRLHVQSQLHDSGELIDIAFSEQKELHATYKEPAEEEEVGPFKIKLAAYAISIRQPRVYVSAMHLARERIKERKAELFSEAKAALDALPADASEAQRQVIGNGFVAAVGKEIGTIMYEITDQMAQKYGDINQAMRPEYRDAAQTLTTMFQSTQKKGRVEQALFDLFDKLEGDAHFRHFIGRGPSAPSATTSLTDRLFNDGKAMSYHLASSKDVMSAVTYAQKTIRPALEAANSLPKGADRDVAMATMRTAAAGMLRNYCRILQKAPPMIDTSEADASSGIPHVAADQRMAEIRKRADTMHALKENWRVQHAGNRYPVTEISGVIDTKLLIAVFDKAASAIEQGYMPTAGKIGVGPLPPELQVTLADMVRSSAKYPLETRDAYRGEGLAI